MGRYDIKDGPIENGRFKRTFYLGSRRIRSFMVDAKTGLSVRNWN